VAKSTSSNCMAFIKKMICGACQVHISIEELATFVMGRVIWLSLWQPSPFVLQA